MRVQQARCAKLVPFLNGRGQQDYALAVCACVLAPVLLLLLLLRLEIDWVQFFRQLTFALETQYNVQTKAARSLVHIVAAHAAYAQCTRYPLCSFKYK